MNLKTISINEIYPDDNQPRKLFDDEALERLSTSIRDNGIEQPIAVRKNGNRSATYAF
jgi:ParB family transcriptional regulator, chromosome partitioning protein